MGFKPLKISVVLSNLLVLLWISTPAWGGYAVQVGAFRELEHAEELASDLMDAGYTVYFETAPNGFRRVRVGPFESRSEAEKAGEALKRAMSLDYFLARAASAPVREEVLVPEPPSEESPAEESLDEPGESSQPERISVTLPSNSTETQFPLEEPPAGEDAEALIAEARSLMGTPYVWAGDSLNEGGFDCSGFIYYLFTKRGYDMNRRASRQFLQGEVIEREDLRPGDLVFFRTYFNGPSHVGIYLGNNEFIHSSSSGNGVVVSAIEGYYDRRYLGARRILGLPPETILASTE